MVYRSQFPLLTIQSQSSPHAQVRLQNWKYQVCAKWWHVNLSQTSGKVSLNHWTWGKLRDENSFLSSVNLFAEQCHFLGCFLCSVGIFKLHIMMSTYFCVYHLCCWKPFQEVCTSTFCWISPKLSSRSVKAFGCIFRFLIHSQLIFVQGRDLVSYLCTWKSS